jgi:hypothetical protein
MQTYTFQSPLSPLSNHSFRKRPRSLLAESVKPSFSEIKLGVKLSAHRTGLPGNVDMITGSAFLPACLPTVGRQGGASSRLARELENTHTKLGENSNKQVQPCNLLEGWPASAPQALPLKAGPCLPAGRKRHNIKGNTFPGSAELHFHDI